MGLLINSFIKNNFLGLYQFVLILMDQIAFLVAFNLSFLFREISGVHPEWNIITYPEYLPLYLFSVLFLMIFFYQKNLYDVSVSVFAYFNLYEIIQAIIRASVMLALFTLFYWKIHAYSRLIIILYFIHLIFWVSVFRMIVFSWFRKLRIKMDIVQNAILLESHSRHSLLRKKIEKNLHHGFRIVKVFRIPENDSEKRKFFIEETNGIDAILVCGEVSAEKWNWLSVYCLGKNLELILFPPVYEIMITSENSSFIAGEFAVRQGNLNSGWGYLWGKKFLDIIFSSFILLILSPVLLGIAIWIKWNSPGPVFFRQERIGKNNKKIRIFKFRTMYVDSPQYEDSPESSGDNRITSAGRILRKLSLDEIPQFINVLNGDMSIVGPRPEMEYKVKNYDDTARIRLSVKPGITGLWQIIGRGDQLELHEDLKYDFYYIQNRSTTLDIKIMIQTLPVILFGEGV